MAREYINREDMLNTGREKLNRSIDKSYDAEDTSKKALEDANRLGNEAKQISTQKGNESILIAKENEKVAGEANLIAKDTNDRMNQIIGGTTDSAEIIDSRKPLGLEASETLGERLNEQFGNNEDFRPSDKSVIQKMKNEFSGRGVNPEWFGAKANGINDDLKAFQAAHDSLPESGGVIIVPMTSLPFLFASEHPEYPKKQLVISKNNVTILFFTNGDVESLKQGITTSVLVDNMIYVKKGVRDFKMENGLLHCKKMVKDAVYSDDFISRSIFFNNRIFNVLNSGINIQTYLTIATRCEVHSSENVGFIFNGDTNNRVQGTSIVVMNCYALNCKQKGYEFNMLTYFKAISCAVDHSVVGYHLKHCYGFSIDSTGAENCLLPLLVEDSESGDVSNYSLPTLPKNEKLDTLIELKNSRLIRIGGVYLNGTNDKFNFKLRLVGDTYGISILDRSIDLPQIDNQTGKSDVYTHLGYAVNSVRREPFIQPLIPNSGVDGHFKVQKGNLLYIELNATLTVTDKSKAKRIAQLPNGHWPMTNTPLKVMEKVTGKKILNGFYVTDSGGIYAVQGGDIRDGAEYAVTGGFNGY